MRSLESFSFFRLGALKSVSTDLPTLFTNCSCSVTQHLSVHAFQDVRSGWNGPIGSKDDRREFFAQYTQCKRSVLMAKITILENAMRTLSLTVNTETLRSIHDLQEKYTPKNTLLLTRHHEKSIR